MIGIVGEPGAGKSTLAQDLVATLSPDAVLVPMDGFHLSNHVLCTLDLRDRKGSPETFDAAGYVALLRRLRHQDDPVVYAPSFRRDIEEPIASSIPIQRTTPIVVTEGNYLLLNDQPWDTVSPLLDAVWYLDVDPDIRLHRLVARHAGFGKSPDQARAWAHGSDQHNADLVAESMARADQVIRLQD